MQALRSRRERILEGFASILLPPGCPETDKLADLCQTWGVTSDGGEGGLAGQVAQELADCRVRGIEWLDIKTHNQDPVAARELQRLAAQYAEARSVRPRGRIAQIKDLLRAALVELQKTNPEDARLIHDLFFGDNQSDDQGPVRKHATDLLKTARTRYGERSEDRFRRIRNRAFRDFAEFLIEFVTSQAQPATSVTSQAQPAISAVAPPSGRRVVHSPLVAVLQFSLDDPGSTGKLTIDEHQKIIAERGRCWWGWFRAAHDVDHSAEIGRRIGSCEVGLWERSENLFYIAHCDGAATAAGNLMESPDKELTPDYYRSQPYPAWFNFTSIRRSSQQEFEERFGYLSSTSSTIHWSSESLPQPVNIPAHGSAILHLSDLHFGQHHRWSTVYVPRTHMTTEQAIVETLLVQGVDLALVGVVVVCGNFVSENPDGEAYSEALAFIDNLCDQLPGITRDHIVVVPGADDFARPGDRERSVQTLYREFHQNLYGGDQDISRMRRYEFDNFRLNILPVNSVKLLGTDERDDGLFGYGYDSQLNVMRGDYLRNHGKTRVINAVAAHHHIMPTTVKLPETAHQAPVGARVMLGMYDSLDIRAKLSASRVALYLHGHLHEPDCFAIISDDGWQTAICGAGTAGASDRWLRSRYRDNHGNSLALIRVEADSIHGSIFVYNEDFRYSSSPFRQFQIKDH